MAVTRSTSQPPSEMTKYRTAPTALTYRMKRSAASRTKSSGPVRGWGQPSCGIACSSSTIVPPCSISEVCLHVMHVYATVPRYMGPERELPGSFHDLQQDASISQAPLDRQATDSSPPALAEL